MKSTEKNLGTNIGRRAVLQAAFAGVFAAFAAPVLTGIVPAHAATKAFGGKKILIAFYSYTGNTRTVAQHIQAQIGGDLFALQPLNPYPEDHKTTTAQAKKELQSGYKPPLKAKIENIAAYDVVFVGSPNWWGTIAGPLKTFLSDNDLSGKIVAPFITHEGSALGRSVKDIKSLCPTASVVSGLAVRGGKVASAQGLVKEWLRSIS